ncbi:MAG: hypothetical protein M3R00_07650 [Pseudomonadota bacterium]|nr:hypothetical protein [Pseudomonadota bacterium]
MITPIALIKLWLEEEQNAGASDAMHAVLSTATLNAIPHGRVVLLPRQ